MQAVKRFTAGGCPRQKAAALHQSFCTFMGMLVRVRAAVQRCLFPNVISAHHIRVFSRWMSLGNIGHRMDLIRVSRTCDGSRSFQCGVLNSYQCVSSRPSSRRSRYCITMYPHTCSCWITEAMGTGSTFYYVCMYVCGFTLLQPRQPQRKRFAAGH
jgi:hypothetical protein